jgi:hypothetical protein
MPRAADSDSSMGGTLRYSSSAVAQKRRYHPTPGSTGPNIDVFVNFVAFHPGAPGQDCQLIGMWQRCHKLDSEAQCATGLP